MQWLLRSLQDAAIGEKYMHRRTVAFATGLTLPAVDKVVQQAKDRGPSAAWFDHFRKIRLVPTHVQTESTLAQMTASHWPAVALDALLRISNRMTSFVRAVMISDVNQVAVGQLRSH